LLQFLGLTISFASHKFAQKKCRKICHENCAFFALHKFAKSLGGKIAGKCALLFACIFGTKFCLKICAKNFDAKKSQTELHKKTKIIPQMFARFLCKFCILQKFPQKIAQKKSEKNCGSYMQI